MGAHAYTMLRDFTNPERQLDPAAVRHALGHSRGGDNFEFEHWQVIVTACEQVEKGERTLEFLQGVLAAFKPVYFRLYVDLDMPRDSREWAERRYPPKETPNFEDGRLDVDALYNE